MIRAIAGILDRRAPPSDRDVAALGATLAAETGAVTTVREGPLALAFTGGAPARDGAALLLIDGILDEQPGVSEPDEATALAAFRRAGPDALLAGIRGDFALLAWDGRSGLLVRDQMGGRTWVWHDDGARMRFATEVNVLLGLLPTRPAADEFAIAHWLGLSGMPGDRTLYHGITRLPAGGRITLDPARRRSAARWWSPRPGPLLDVDRDQAVGMVRDAVCTAVARRAGAHETAVLLSGGLDSASVAGAAAATLPTDRRPRRGYSAIFPEHPSVDEAALIARLCDSFGLRSTRVVVRSGSVLYGALPYIERWALPPVSPNLFFWIPLLERAAGDGTAILLDGEGGDELFGISPYLLADLLARGRVRAAAGLVHQVPGAHDGLSAATVRSWLLKYGLRGLAPPALHALSRRLHGPQHYVADWFRPDTAQAFVASNDGAAFKRHGGPRWWAWLLDVVTRGMGPALAHDHVRRRAAMAGLIARHPLADVDVIELVLRLPPQLAFDARLSRPLLRGAVAGIVPDEVRLRPTKSTFDAIFHDALAGPDLPLARTLLGDRGARVGAYVDLATVRARLLDPGPPREAGERMQWALHIWRLLTAECWLCSQEDPALPRRMATAAGLRGPDLELTEAH